MLRIHFTGRDLASVRLARRPDPLWEIVCSLCRLQNREGAIAFDPWRRAVGGLARRDGASRRAASALRSLVPRAAYFPDFLTPPVENGTDDLRSGIDRVLAPPRHRLRHELALLSASGGRPWAGSEPEPITSADADTRRSVMRTDVCTFRRPTAPTAWDGPPEPPVS
ncbi:hypothetical protein [Streptomyces sp. TE33382]